MENNEAVLACYLFAKGRRAAEYAYVLAMLAKRQGKMAEAYDYAEKSITLFEASPSDTLADCAAHEVVVAGVALPSIIHADVVRNRFKCFPAL